MYFVTASLQLLTYAVLYFPVKFLFRATILRHSNYSTIEKSVILTPNHQSRLDIFLIYAALPPKLLIKLVPIYSIVAYQYMNTWWKYLILVLYGCFPLRKETVEAPAALLHILDLIDKSKTILLFPEGKVVNKWQKSPADAGIGYIASRKDVEIVPIYLTGFANVTVKKLLLRKYRATIIIGAPQGRYYKSRSNPKLIAQAVLDTIYSLRKFTQ